MRRRGFIALVGSAGAMTFWPSSSRAQHAERVRRIGGTTIRSVSHISELQTIDDDNEEFVPWDRMIHRLLDDNRQMAEAQRAAIEVCEDNRDTPTANLLQEILNETEKRIWFLNEICQ